MQKRSAYSLRDRGGGMLSRDIRKAVLLIFFPPMIAAKRSFRGIGMKMMETLSGNTAPSECAVSEKASARE